MLGPRGWEGRFALATKANHHFIPQFYLREFADGVGRKARVFTFDSETKKSFTTLVRNVGSRRHFNRIEVDGIDPNALEDAFAEMESEISVHLKEVVEARSFPSDEHFTSIMNLMAHLSVRNPRLRKNMEVFHRDIVQRIMHLTLDSKERWESQTEKMQAEGIPIRKDVSYEDVKAFHESGQYDILIDQTHLISLELKMLDPVLERLAARNWCFASASDGTEYITSDDPVVLSWSHDRDTGPYSPGHGLKGTLVTFTLCPSLALVGAFEDMPESITHLPNMVTGINTHIARYSTNQIYANNPNFRVNLKDVENVLGSDLPRLMK